MRWPLRAGVALVLLTASACDRPDASGAAVPDTALAVIDAEGRRVRLDAPARRVVSLVPSVTRTLLAMDAGDRLVGRTDFDADPALSGLPTVGGGLGPDLETLASLEPDLVVRFAGDSDRTTPGRLDDLGIPHLAVRPDRIADVRSTIVTLGTLLDLEGPARALSARLDDGLAAVRDAVAGRPPVRAAYLMGGSPPWTAGDGTYIDELIGLAGGENVFSDVTGLYGAVSPEVVAARAIDVVLLAEGARIDGRLLEGRTVRRVPADLQIPGPDLIEAAWTVARALHPDLPPER